jgi:hypothetical protein
MGPAHDTIHCCGRQWVRAGDNWVRLNLPHGRGAPCQEERCPACGAKLLREGSEYHRLFLEKQAKKRQQQADDESV